MPGDPRISLLVDETMALCNNGTQSLHVGASDWVINTTNPWASG